MSFRKQRDDHYETALDDVIARCGGDTRGALKALLAANEYLETELNKLHMAIEAGKIPFHATQTSRMLLN
ncbi:MAG: hypothetical protein J0G37_02390 [Afipia sp.]|jgi:hypothetical protein|nr:hypothetical protein [Afipia sp.]